MRLYLAESGNLYKRIDRVHQAATGENLFEGKSFLHSFYYCDSFVEERIIPHAKSFLLDSGAFTFMQNAWKGGDWLDYQNKYVQFIRRNNVQLFFELDLDSVIGYDGVLELRKRLEDGTGRKCIPVWHKSRGKEEWLRMCEEYDYVAIGGIVTGEFARKDHRLFHWFLNEAHKRGTRVHGLGFTHLSKLHEYAFDSVDSSSWSTGNRFGHYYRFDGKSLAVFKRPAGKRIADHDALAYNNFVEWAKYQQYMETPRREGRSLI